MSTYMAKPQEVEQKWLLVDATDKVVGRLASEIAVILMGKHRPTYTPHVDTGDFVVVTNCEKVHFSGKKWDQKTYAWYTGYPGQRTVKAADRMAKRPESEKFELAQFTYRSFCVSILIFYFLILTCFFNSPTTRRA